MALVARPGNTNKSTSLARPGNTKKGTFFEPRTARYQQERLTLWSKRVDVFQSRGLSSLKKALLGLTWGVSRRFEERDSRQRSFSARMRAVSCRDGWACGGRLGAVGDILSSPSNPGAQIPACGTGREVGEIQRSGIRRIVSVLRQAFQCTLNPKP